MRKLLSTMMLMPLMVLADAWTDPETGIKWIYTISEGKAQVGSSDAPAISTGTVGAITIPSTLGGYPVTSIGKGAFRACDELTSVIIPLGITSVGEDAFLGCDELTTVVLPIGVVSIGCCAFADCVSLVSVSLPSSVTNIGANAFYDTGIMTSHLDGMVIVDGCLLAYKGECPSTVAIPNGVRLIADSVFSECKSLCSIDISDGVKNIGGRAFFECSSLTSVAIPEGVQMISASTFESCTSLTSVVMPSSVTSIGKLAFYNCRSLTSVKIPEHVTNIGLRAFYGCGKLTAVEIPPSVLSIEKRAFEACGGLKYVIIDDGVISIGEWAFYGCSELLSVTIPMSVTSIGELAFYGCGKLTSVTIPDSVTNIGARAFADCRGLEHLTLPFVGARRGNVNDKESLFGYIFGDWSAYSGITSTRQYYSESGYSDYYIPLSLKSVVVTDETKIGYGAFYGCKGLTSVTISNSVTNIGKFAFSGCSSLTNMVLPFVGAARNKTGTEDALFGYIFGTVAYSGARLVRQYYTERGYFSGVYLPSSLRTVTITDESIVGYGAFYECDGLTSVVFSESLTGIDGKAFYCCSGLGSLTIPASCRYIGASAFWCCDGIPSVSIPEGVVHIANNAFGSCGGLSSVSIPTTVTNLGEQAFYNCSNLSSVAMLASNLRVGNNAFSRCVKLDSVEINDVAAWCKITFESPSANPLYCAHKLLLNGAEVSRVEIPGNVKVVGPYSFCGCTSLNDVVILEGVEDVGVGCFSGCTALQHVVFPYSLKVTREKLRGWGLSDAVLDDYVEGDFVIVNKSLLGYVGAADVAELAIPDGIELIDEYALAELYDLERVELPETVKYIGKGAFANDTYLDEAVLPDSVEVIGEGAFADCSWMQTMTMGAGVRSVGDRAFAGCTKLAAAKFEDGLGEVGDAAFSNCWRMMSVSLPVSVSNVAATAFKECASLTGVTVPTSIAPLSQWFAPVYRQIKDVTIPSGETLVCSNMFKGCSALVSVDIPEGVTNIGGSAFEDCVNLPSVELPSSLQSVGESAFRNCDAVTAIGLPDAVRSVGAYAFYDCYRLKDVSLSKNLESLPDHVFDACPQLDSIYVPASVTQLGSHIFGGAMSAVYFIGNAPAYDADVYASTGSGLVTYVKYGTKGWDGRPTSRDLPQMWPMGNSYGRSIMTWDPVQFDVTFDAGEGVFHPVEAQTYACEQVMYTAYSLPPFNPVRKGYKFAGWWTEAVGGAEVTPSTGVSSDRPHTLYAHWDESFIVTVRFNACGGTVLPNEIEYTAEVPFGTLPVPTREHYIFTGWYTAASGGSIVRVSTEVPKADRELFAHWSPAHYTIRFNANNGTGATATQSFIYGQDVTLRANGFSCSGCEFVGWSLTPGGEAVYADGKTISGLAAIEDGVIDLYAVWTGNVYAVRFDSHGGLGVMPNQTFVLGVSQKLSHCTFTRSGYVFKGWALSTTAEVSYGDGEKVCNLTASKSATVVLFAVWERDPHGEWTVAEYLNCTNLTFTLGGDTPLWYGEKVARADKVGMMRSGAIGDSQTNWIETVVSGAGQIGFWWKANGEYEVSKKGVITRYDYAEFTIDGAPVEEIGDESDWTYVTIPVGGTGSHILRWMYHKDESGSDGDDCVWLSEVSWEPTQVVEPIPELPENPTAEDVQLALAGSADSTLLAHVTDAATYYAYREWALKIGATDVKASPFAWASFATDSAALLGKMPTDDDLKVEEFKPSATAGSFGFTVSVKDVTIGDKASVDNLKKLFGLEGAESLDTAAFSSDNVALDFKEPQDGKLKFTATPAVDDAKSFFMKVKVK